MKFTSVDRLMYYMYPVAIATSSVMYHGDIVVMFFSGGWMSGWSGRTLDDL